MTDDEQTFSRVVKLEEPARELAWPHVRAVTQTARLLLRSFLCAGDDDRP